MKSRPLLELTFHKDLRMTAQLLLDYIKDGGSVKDVAKKLETLDPSGLKGALILEAQVRGVVLPEDAHEWPYKKLIRRARGLDIEARKRKNPIRRDEAFICDGCGYRVPAHGRTARNHCPKCLCSKHVDVVPGDRQAACGGLMVAVSVSKRKDTYVLLHRCQRCGHERPNRVLMDGSPADDWKMITELSKKGAPT